MSFQSSSSAFSAGRGNENDQDDVVMSEPDPSPPATVFGRVMNFIATPYRWMTAPSKAELLQKQLEAVQAQRVRDLADEEKRMKQWDVVTAYLPRTKYMDHKVILLGQTGSGKSTFINTLANYFRGGSLTCDRKLLKVIIPSCGLPGTEKEASQAPPIKNINKSMQSQTDSCFPYHFKSGDGHSYHCIDTPGIGDTAGTEKDDANLANILDEVTNLEGKKITALILIINGTESRSTTVLKMALTRLRASCPDVVMTNLLVVLTNCTRDSKNFDTDLLNIFNQAIPKEHIFYVDNKFFRDVELTPQSLRDEFGPAWTKSMRTIDDLRRAIHNMEPSSTEDFVIMREHRMQLKVELASVLAEIDRLDRLRMSLVTEKERRDKAQENSFANENFVKNEQLQEWEQEATTRHNTLCGIHHSNCHVPCGLSEVASVGASELSGCWAMSGGNTCRVCEDACTVHNHYHAKYQWKSKYRTVQVVMEDIKKLHSQYLTELEASNRKLTEYEINLDLIDHALNAKVQGIEEIAAQLQHRCTQVSVAQELQCVLETLDQASKTLVTPEAIESSKRAITNLKILTNKLNKSKAAHKPQSATSAVSSRPVSKKRVLDVIDVSPEESEEELKEEHKSKQAKR